MSKMAIPQLPFRVDTPEFIQNRYQHYQWMLREAPICRAQMSMMRMVLISPYAECRSLLQDARFVRNRESMSGRSFPMPLPRGMKLMLKGLVTQDDPIHRRQRLLVAKAFTPRALSHLEHRVQQIVEEVLDSLESQTQIELMQSYCLPIPSQVIREMLGIESEDMEQFQNLLSAMTQSFSGWTMLQTILFKFPKAIQFVEHLLNKKRECPTDDILTGLVQAEENGQKLSHDELVAMTLTLIVAGYETTVHLIGNAVVALLTYPEQLARLQEKPELLDTTIEEVLRFYSPFQYTKPHFATSDVELLGVIIPKGAMVMPVLGAANRDPAVFESPETFDITRSPNKHLAFGHGIHHCLGAALARMEGKAALSQLLERFPYLRLNVEVKALNQGTLPTMHRYNTVPVVWG